jgi:hypothetical protein
MRVVKLTEKLCRFASVPPRRLCTVWASQFQGSIDMRVFCGTLCSSQRKGASMKLIDVLFIIYALVVLAPIIGYQLVVRSLGYAKEVGLLFRVVATYLAIMTFCGVVGRLIRDIPVWGWGQFTLFILLSVLAPATWLLFSVLVLRDCQTLYQLRTGSWFWKRF